MARVTGIKGLIRIRQSEDPIGPVDNLRPLDPEQAQQGTGGLVYYGTTASDSTIGTMYTQSASFMSWPSNSTSSSSMGISGTWTSGSAGGIIWTQMPQTGYPAVPQSPVPQEQDQQQEAPDDGGCMVTIVIDGTARHYHMYPEVAAKLRQDYKNQVKEVCSYTTQYSPAGGDREILIVPQRIAILEIVE